MEIQYADLVLLNGELKERGNRYRVGYKGEDVACLLPPGECCWTGEMEEDALNRIRAHYQAKGERVTFSEDRLYFRVQKGEGDFSPSCSNEM